MSFIKVSAVFTWEIPGEEEGDTTTVEKVGPLYLSEGSIYMVNPEGHEIILTNGRTVRILPDSMDSLIEIIRPDSVSAEV